ncbi:MAG: LysM peptidoglycan-binding domain-containing protein [Pseudomonadota bacterium]
MNAGLRKPHGHTTTVRVTRPALAFLSTLGKRVRRWALTSALLSVIAGLPHAAAVAGASGASAPPAPHLNGRLPRPAGLAPWVDFWRDIYGARHDGVLTLHDARDVSVVYAVLETAPGQSMRARFERAEPEIAAFQRALQDVADGLRHPTSPYQDRVLWLWDGKLDPATLREAAQHIRMQVGHADTFRTALQTAHRWRPWINRVLDAHGLPRDLGAIPFVETFFRNEVAPDSGARGIWQFTNTAARRDMYVDEAIDERLSFYKSTLAAARLLSHNYAITRRWPLAVTAYNHGTRGVIRAVRELNTRDLGVIARRYAGPEFGFASRNFYAQVLAAAEVEQQRDHFFGAKPAADTARTRFALKLRSPRTLREVSVEQNISVAGLRSANPDVMSDAFEKERRLPAGFTLWVNCVDDCPTPDALLSQSDRPAVSDYTVKSGDTLGHIAVRMDTTVAELARVNQLNPSAPLQIGYTLHIPSSDAKSRYIDFPAELSFDGAYDAEPSGIDEHRQPQPVQFDSSVALLRQLRASRPRQPDASATTVVLPNVQEYKLLDSDTLALLHGESTGLIARWLDLDTKSIHDFNGLEDGAILDIGHRLALPFTHVNGAEFERRRLRYHRDRQYAWYQKWSIDGTIEYAIQPGDRLWQIAEKQYNVPHWLLLEYNPTLDFSRVRPGQLLTLPRIQAKPMDGRERQAS